MCIEQNEWENFIGREFRHFKGGHYRLEGFAKDSETLEPMVVYRALYGEGGLWVRPAKMFFDGLQHARPPYPSPTPKANSNSCPSRW